MYFFFFLSLFLFLISLSLFSSQLRNLPRTLNGLVLPSAPLLRADLFYLFAQPRGKSADYVEIPSPKPSESTSFQSFSRSFLFSPLLPLFFSLLAKLSSVYSRVRVLSVSHALRQTNRSSPIAASFRRFSPAFRLDRSPGTTKLLRVRKARPARSIRSNERYMHRFHDTTIHVTNVLSQI